MREQPDRPRPLPTSPPERLETAVRNHVIGIFETDPISGIVYWNAELEEIFDYEPGEFDGRLSTWRSHLTPADVTRLDQQFAKAIENKITTLRYAYTMCTRLGRLRHIEASAQFYYDNAGNHTRRVGVNIDVTDRVAEEARLRMMFDQMHEGFMACELIYNSNGVAIDYRYLEVNGPIERLTGLDREKNLGKRAYELMPGLEKFWLETFAQVVKTGKPATFTHFAAPLSRWYRVHAYRYAEGFFAALFLDVTAQKKAEASIRKAQRDAMKSSRLSAIGAMASTLAHELNQPLQAAANYLAVAQLAAEKDVEIKADVLKEAVEGALSANLRAGEIIKRIRLFTLEGYVEKDIVDIGSIIDTAAVDALSDDIGRGILLQINLHEPSPSVLGNKTQLEQVFSNLFRNAAAAMQLQQSPRQISINTEREGSFIRLRVTDTGHGLTERQLKYIFAPFETSKEGLGLGLAICRTIVEAHGGSISAKSQAGSGAEFIVRLPRAPSDRV